MRKMYLCRNRVIVDGPVSNWPEALVISLGHTSLAAEPDWVRGHRDVHGVVPGTMQRWLDRG
jgi:hypothetical protein